MPRRTAPDEGVQPCEPLPLLLDMLPMSAVLSCTRQWKAHSARGYGLGQCGAMSSRHCISKPALALTLRCWTSIASMPIWRAARRSPPRRPRRCFDRKTAATVSRGSQHPRCDGETALHAVVGWACTSVGFCRNQEGLVRPSSLRNLNATGLVTRRRSVTLDTRMPNGMRNAVRAGMSADCCIELYYINTTPTSFLALIASCTKARQTCDARCPREFLGSGMLCGR